MLMSESGKSKKLILSKTFSVVFCLVVFGLMITMADFFSSLITVGGFSFVNDNITFAEYKVYAVCTSSHQEKLLASEFCETIKQQGGAGYIYINENLYYIVAGMYETESDANKVLNNIIAGKPEATIIEIKIPAITISNNLSAQEKNTLNGCLGVFKNAYKKLYDISVSLDTVIINEVNARLMVNELCSTVQTAIGNFNTIFTENVSTSLLKIKLANSDVVKYLNELSESTSAYPFTSLVKECYCKIITTYKQMASQI